MIALFGPGVFDSEVRLRSALARPFGAFISRRALSSHLELHVLELDRWRQNPDLATPAGLRGWMRFFTEAETWREVPRDIDTPVLESAMPVLTDFQTNAARNDLYRSRLDYLRVQNTMADELAQALAKEAQALARETRLRERMLAAGLDPDSE